MEEAKVNQVAFDTKGNCFFCLKKFSCDNPKASKRRRLETPRTTSFSLKFLSKYLNLDVRSIFSISSLGLQFSVVDNSHIVVAVCENCSFLAGQFAELFKEFDLIKVRLNGCLQEIHDVMVGAENDVTSFQEYRQRVVESCSEMELVTMGIVEKLRKETIARSLTRLKRDNPEVHLEKVQAQHKELNQSLNELPVQSNEEQIQPSYQNNVRDKLQMRKGSLNKRKACSKSAVISQQVQELPCGNGNEEFQIKQLDKMQTRKSSMSKSPDKAAPLSESKQLDAEMSSSSKSIVGIGASGVNNLGKRRSRNKLLHKPETLLKGEESETVMEQDDDMDDDYVPDFDEPESKQRKKSELSMPMRVKARKRSSRIRAKQLEKIKIKKKRLEQALLEKINKKKRLEQVRLEKINTRNRQKEKNERRIAQQVEIEKDSTNLEDIPQIENVQQVENVETLNTSLEKRMTRKKSVDKVATETNQLEKVIKCNKSLRKQNERKDNVEGEKEKDDDDTKSQNLEVEKVKRRKKKQPEQVTDKVLPADKPVTRKKQLNNVETGKNLVDKVEVQSEAVEKPQVQNQQLKKTRNKSPEKFAIRGKSLEKVEPQNKPLELVDPQNKLPEKVGPQNKSLEKVGPQNKSLELVEPQNKSLEQTEPQNKSLEQAEPQNKLVRKTRNKSPAKTESKSQQETVELQFGEAIPQTENMQVDSLNTQNVQIGKVGTQNMQLRKARKNSMDKVEPQTKTPEVVETENNVEAGPQVKNIQKEKVVALKKPLEKSDPQKSSKKAETQKSLEDVETLNELLEKRKPRKRSLGKVEIPNKTPEKRETRKRSPEKITMKIRNKSLEKVELQTKQQPNSVNTENNINEATPPVQNSLVDSDRSQNDPCKLESSEGPSKKLETTPEKSCQSQSRNLSPDITQFQNKNGKTSKRKVTIQPKDPTAEQVDKVEAQNKTLNQVDNQNLDGLPTSETDEAAPKDKTKSKPQTSNQMNASKSSDHQQNPEVVTLDDEDDEEAPLVLFDSGTKPKSKKQSKGGSSRKNQPSSSRSISTPAPSKPKESEEDNFLLDILMSEYDDSHDEDSYDSCDYSDSSEDDEDSDEAKSYSPSSSTSSESSLLSVNSSSRIRSTPDNNLSALSYSEKASSLDKSTAKKLKPVTVTPSSSKPSTSSNSLIKTKQNISRLTPAKQASTKSKIDSPNLPKGKSKQTDVPPQATPRVTRPSKKALKEAQEGEKLESKIVEGSSQDGISSNSLKDTGSSEKSLSVAGTGVEKVGSSKKLSAVTSNTIIQVVGLEKSSAVTSNTNIQVISSEKSSVAAQNVIEESGSSKKSSAVARNIIEESGSSKKSSAVARNVIEESGSSKQSTTIDPPRQNDNTEVSKVQKVAASIPSKTAILTPPEEAKGSKEALPSEENSKEKESSGDYIATTLKDLQQMERFDESLVSILNAAEEPESAEKTSGVNSLPVTEIPGPSTTIQPASDKPGLEPQGGTFLAEGKNRPEPISLSEAVVVTPQPQPPKPAIISLPETCQPPLPPKPSKSTKCVCHFCGRNLDNKVSLVQHLKSHANYCNLCAVNLIDNKSLIYHILKRHPNQLFSSHKTPPLSETEFKARVETIIDSFVWNNEADDIQCRLCSSTFRHVWDVESHLIEVHYDRVAQELEKPVESNPNAGVEEGGISNLNLCPPQPPHQSLESRQQLVPVPVTTVVASSVSVPVTPPYDAMISNFGNLSNNPDSDQIVIFLDSMDPDIGLIQLKQLEEINGNAGPSSSVAATESSPLTAFVLPQDEPRQQETTSSTDNFLFDILNTP